MNTSLMTTCLSMLLIGSFFQVEGQVPSQGDFYSLMGSKTAAWSYVESRDQPILDLLAKSYDLQKDKIAHITQESIPKTFHFIWIGPKSFPEASKKNIESWISYHPDYEIYFWTDYVRELPHPKMKLQLINEFSFNTLKNQFDDSDNFAEKADVLRYEILEQIGGIYIDHDVECFRSLDSLFKSFDLVCGIEPLHKPLGDSSVTICNNLIAATPHHEALKQCIQLVHDKWDPIGKYFPLRDVASITQRVFHRTFSPFDQAVKMRVESGDEGVYVAPAQYFNNLENVSGLYANHQYASSWFESETTFEHNVRVKLTKLAKKLNLLLTTTIFLGLSQLVLISILVMSLKKIRVLSR